MEILVGLYGDLIGSIWRSYRVYMEILVGLYGDLRGSIWRS